MDDKTGATRRPFWAELKRRGVISTTIAYVIGASILVEGTDLVEDILDLPEWLPKTVLVLAVFTLPLVVILAWYFNIKLDRPENNTNDRQGKDEVIDFDRLPVATPLNPLSADASIAVLPFENLSTDDTDKFLAVGFALELHSTLSGMHRLRIASHTLTFGHAKSGMDTKCLATKLNVNFILSGSVCCVSDRIHVHVELANTIEGVQLWSETYDREMNDVFSVQHDIAQSVVNAFPEVRLREEIATATLHPTPNAWSRVQRARSYVLEFTPKALSNAVLPLRESIDLDNDHSAAHAALASVLAEQIINGLSKSPDEDRKTSLSSADRAFSLSPTDPFVLKMCGAVWAYFGKTDMAISALRRAVDRAPFDFGAWGYMGWPLVETGAQRDLDELHDIMQRIIRATPHHPGVAYWNYHRSVAYTCEARDEDAAEFAKESVEKNPAFPWGWMQYANVLGRVGRAHEARSAIERCKKISPVLTPAYYERMIAGMYDDGDFRARRLQGLIDLALL